jgi:hypothetical protein
MVERLKGNLPRPAVRSSRRSPVLPPSLPVPHRPARPSALLLQLSRSCRLSRPPKRWGRGVHAYPPRHPRLRFFQVFPVTRPPHGPLRRRYDFRITFFCSAQRQEYQLVVLERGAGYGGTLVNLLGRRISVAKGCQPQRALRKDQPKMCDPKNVEQQD